MHDDVEFMDKEMHPAVRDKKTSIYLLESWLWAGMIYGI